MRESLAGGSPDHFTYKHCSFKSKISLSKEGRGAMVPEKMVDLHEGDLEVKIPTMDQPLIEDVSDREGVSRSSAS